MAFLFPGKTKAGLLNVPGAGRMWSGEGEMWGEIAGRTAGIRQQTQRYAGVLEGRRASDAASAHRQEVADRPWYTFMAPGAEREAAEARAGYDPAAAGARAGRRVLRGGGARGGGTVLSGRQPADQVKRFAVTEKPQTKEMADRLTAYRKRERRRIATARAGEKSVLRRPSRSR